MLVALQASIGMVLRQNKARRDSLQCLADLQASLTKVLGRSNFPATSTRCFTTVRSTLALQRTYHASSFVLGVELVLQTIYSYTESGIDVSMLSSEYHKPPIVSC